MPVRLLAGVGPPLAVGVAWWIGYGIVDAWPESPPGDTDFAWLGLVDIEFTLALAVLGLFVLAARQAWGVVLIAWVLWLIAVVVLFVEVPSYGEYFPDTGRTFRVMAMCAAASLTPSLLVSLWAAAGRVVPHAQEATDSPRAGEPGDLGAAHARLTVGTADQAGAEPRSRKEAHPADGSDEVRPAQWRGPVPVSPPPGWYAVPGGPAGQLRWWDGTSWTGYVWPPG